MEGASAGVHRAPLRQELRPTATGSDHVFGGVGRAQKGKESGRQGNQGSAATANSARGRQQMSEYQYYEFQAIDRPLTGNEMEELRSCSSRARIKPTSFVNEYSWGSFKGNEDVWMEKYFDAFLFLANWG